MAPPRQLVHFGAFIHFSFRRAKMRAMMGHITALPSLGAVGQAMEWVTFFFMFNFFMREISVLGLMSSSSAAPPGP